MSTFHTSKNFGHLPNFFFLLISPGAVLHIPIRMSANLNIWLNTLCIVFTPFHFLKKWLFFRYLLPARHSFNRAPNLFYEPIRFPPPVGVPDNTKVQKTERNSWHAFQNKSSETVELHS